MGALVEFAAAALVFITLISAVLVLLAKVGRTAKRIDQAIGEDVEGKTLAQRHHEQGKLLSEMDRRVSKVEELLSPPGQESLPARVNKLEHEVDDVRTEVRLASGKLDILTGLVREDIEGRDNETV